MTSPLNKFPFKCVDQLGRSVLFQSPPTRIVSLVPSQTELLFDLGLEKEVVGITKFCIHPSSWHNSKTRVGGTKDFKIDLIRSLHPDLILANKEENTEEGLQELMNEFPVWISDIRNLQQAKEMITAVGEMTGKNVESELLLSAITSAFDRLAFEMKSDTASKSVVYYIWKNPWMVAGNDTFIHDMLLKCGLEVRPGIPRYPELSPAALADNPPDFVFLSSEPFPFNATHQEDLQKILPKTKVLLVDGEYFSWYGSRLKNAPSYFKSIILP